MSTTNTSNNTIDRFTTDTQKIGEYIITNPSLSEVDESDNDDDDDDEVSINSNNNNINDISYYIDSVSSPISPPPLNKRYKSIQQIWYTPSRNIPDTPNKLNYSSAGSSVVYTTTTTTTTTTPPTGTVTSISSKTTAITSTPIREPFAANICQTPLVGSLSILQLVQKSTTATTRTTSTTTTANIIEIMNNTNDNNPINIPTIPSTTYIDPPHVADMKDVGTSTEEDTPIKSSSSSTILTKQQQRMIPLFSFIIEGLRHKARFGLNTYNQLTTSTLDGRDKYTKLLQYICRFLAWWLSSSSSSSLKKILIAERFNALKTSLSNSRKAFRLGRSMLEIQKLQALGILQWIRNYIMKQYQQQQYDSAMNKNNNGVPFWNIAGNTVKSIGLLIFWAADNISFLTQSGFLDNYQNDISKRIQDRNQFINKTTTIANRSYFIGAIAGFITNWITYWNYTNKTIQKLQEDSINPETKNEETIALQKGQEKQFTLFLALVKSICDILVFSNNPGVDIWKKYIRTNNNKPMHEGIHCLCGIISASVVLYNNYPNDDNDGV